MIFRVHGEPASQGSKRLVRAGARTIMLEQSKKVKPWRAAVATAALEHGCAPFDGDVSVRVCLLFNRPESHFGKRGLLPSAPGRPGYIDVDKGARAILDALAGIAYHNDRQVAVLRIERAWSPDNGAGAVIEINPISTPVNG